MFIMQILKNLRHPNIVRAFGGLCEDDQRFYAMELVPGGTLRELLKQQIRFPWEQAVEYAIQMCAALSCAHEQGVIHRDVKPGNFLVTKKGMLKLSDFGLATVAASAKITTDGRTAGTFQYMAPEQIRGRPVPSPQTDLYALGCVLFQMLTGDPPFVGDAAAATLHMHLKDKPPLVSGFVPDCPPEMENLVSDLLNKKPEDRPESAVVVMRRLREISPLISVVGDRPTVEVSTRGFEQEATDSESHSEITTSLSSTPRWLIPSCLAVVAVLLYWNISLQQQRAVHLRSEQLWREAYVSHIELAVRYEAAKSLGEIGQLTDETLTSLLEGLSDENAEIRRLTLVALGKLGAPSKRGIPKIMKIQRNDNSPQVRNQADETLKQIAESRSRFSFWSLLLPACLLGGVFCLAKYIMKLAK